MLLVRSAEMQRRTLLGLGTIGLGAAAMDGCVALPWAETPALSKDDLDRILRNLDTTLAALRDSKARTAETRDAHAMVTKTLSTLYLMGTYRDLPEAAKSQPRVQERLAEALPEIRDTTIAARNWLVEMDTTLRARIDARLRKDPDLTMRVMESIDDYAKQQRVPIEHRTYLRTSAAQLGWRMRNQGSKAVIDDLAAKWDRGVAQKRALLGVPAEGEEDSQPGVVRARFRTRASVDAVHKTTCLLLPRSVIDGRERPIDLKWQTKEQTSDCPASADADAIAGTVSAERANNSQGGETVVVVELVLPADAPQAMDELRGAVVDIGNELKRRVFVGRPPEARGPLGSSGESCESNADYWGKCVSGRCAPIADPQPPPPGSKKLLRTTADVAKWGVILLIPPICFVGVLILLAALVMVIVAGFMAAGGD